jgi:hypothetical protein
MAENEYEPPKYASMGQLIDMLNTKYPGWIEADCIGDGTECEFIVEGIYVYADHGLRCDPNGTEQSVKVAAWEVEYEEYEVRLS